MTIIQHFSHRKQVCLSNRKSRCCLKTNSSLIPSIGSEGSKHIQRLCLHLSERSIWFNIRAGTAITVEKWTEKQRFFQGRCFRDLLIKDRAQHRWQGGRARRRDIAEDVKYRGALRTSSSRGGIREWFRLGAPCWAFRAALCTASFKECQRASRLPPLSHTIDGTLLS